MTAAEKSRGGPFSVYQFFTDGSHERVREHVGSEEAVNAARHYCSSVAAQLGMTVRVIITDALDFCVFDWQADVGVVWPRDVDVDAFELPQS